MKGKTDREIKNARDTSRCKELLKDGGGIVKLCCKIILGQVN